MKNKIKRVTKIENGKRFYNFYDKKRKKMVLFEWLQTAPKFENGKFCIQLSNGIWNYLNEEGEFLFKGFLYVGITVDGLTRVQRIEDKLWNYLKKDGTFLMPLWLEEAEDFYDDLAVILLPHAEFKNYNFITKDGNFLCDEFFVKAKSFHEGFAYVQRKNLKYNFICKDGSRLSPFDLSRLEESFSNGKALATRDDQRQNYLTTNGTYLSDEWFYKAEKFHDKIARVQLESGSFNYLTLDGKFLSSITLSEADPIFIDGFAVVANVDRKFNVLREDGTYIGSEWFNYVRRRGNSIIVCRENEFNYVLSDGSLYLKVWIKLLKSISDC